MVFHVLMEAIGLYKVRRALKRWQRDEQLEVRSENTAARVAAREGDLQALNRKLDEAFTAHDTKQVETVLKEQKKIVGKITDDLPRLIENEYVSCRNDITEPFEAIRTFVEIISHHAKSLQDPKLRSILSSLFKVIEDKYAEITAALEKQANEQARVFGREFTGAGSEYAHSVGDEKKLGELIAAREIQKKELDKHIRSVLTDLKIATTQVKTYLESEERGNNLRREKMEIGRWYRFGDNEYRKTQSGRWFVKKAGAQKVPGVFAKESARPREEDIVHYGLLQYLEEFQKHFATLVEYIEHRLEFSKQVLGHAGYLLHRLEEQARKTEQKAVASAGDDRKEVAKIISIEKVEEARVKRVERTAMLHARDTARMTKRFGSNANKFIAASVAGALAVGAAISAVKTAKGNEEAVKTSGAFALVSPADALNQAMRDVAQSNFTLTTHFKFDRWDQTINGVKDTHDLFKDIYAAIVTASRHAGYTDLAKFIKDSNFRMKIFVRGYASPDGNEYYNFNLSANRAAFMQAKVQEFNEQFATAYGGAPIIDIQIAAAGESGETDILDSLGLALVTTPNRAIPLVDNISSNLGLLERKKVAQLLQVVQTARKIKAKTVAADEIMRVLHRNKHLDKSLLAPYRKAVVEVDVEYDKQSGPGPILIAVDSLDVQAPMPAILPTPLPVGLHRVSSFQGRVYRGRAGYQKPFKKSRWTQRGPFGV